MELKAGYKKTDIGLLPIDWNIDILEGYATRIGSGITPKGGESSYKKEGRPLVRSQNVGKLILNDIAFIDDETHQTFPNTEIKINDVFLNISGASIGRSSYANDKLVGGNVNQHVCIIRTIKKKLNPIFLNLFLLSNKGQKLIDSFQSGGNRQGLNIGQIRTFQIPIPTLTEQTAIATALSDADALIASIEKLISKKRLIKQGAMQKLLSPKEGWEIKSLGEIAEIYTGKKNNQDKVENGVYPFFVRSQSVERINSYSFDGEAILIPGEGNIGKIFHYINGKFDFHQRVYKISNFKEGYFGKYIYRYISENFGKHAMENSVKATVDSLRLPTFQVFEIPFPPALKEQVHLATILSDMDTEIEGLETKLEKYKQIKQGMMQNLLTGKIRLVKPNSNELEENINMAAEPNVNYPKA
jgi:type I restriction enzyme S subunit